LLIGITLCLITRLVMLASGNAFVVLACGLIPLALGEALCTPVLVAATRKYSTPTQRSVAFSVFYSILNLGFMFAYFIRDGVQTGALANGGLCSIAGISLSPQRMLFLVSFGIELLALPFILMLRDKPLAVCGDVAVSWMASVGNAARETGRLFGALVRHPGFRRLLLFLLMIGLLKIVFNIMDAVLPTFAEREIGGEGAKCVGRLNAVNSILILILAPLVGGLTRRMPAYSMVIFGGLITAFSFVFMVLPSTEFQGLAENSFGQWFGHAYLRLEGTVHPYLIMILLWQIAFSIGEAFYSPRVYEYAVSIAPEGQEASYASLSAVPLLMGKFINSAVFAGLLTRFCPAEGPRNPGKMWLIIGLLVLVAPVGLFVFRRFIRMKEEGREESVS
jgi:MFS family permease